MEVLTYVYTVCVMQNVAKTLGIRVEDIETFFEKCWRLESTPRHLWALRQCQRRWRRSRDRGRDYVNAEDPFTLEPLGDLAEGQVWSYVDSKGHRYGFDADIMMHFIETQGSWNPYTREAIPEADVRRLREGKTQTYRKTDFTVVWRTPRDAFVDVLYHYEIYGFYTDIDWFLNLTPMDIIGMYRLLQRDRFIPDTVFRMATLEAKILEDPENGAGFHLAREMQWVIQANHDFKFYIVCNVFVVLAKIRPSLRRALPPWTHEGAQSIR
jgi:hypothetical protein